MFKKICDTYEPFYYKIIFLLKIGEFALFFNSYAKARK